MRKLTKLIIAVAALAMMPFQASAVTDKEMEEARTIAAKAYLRYANNGSGYLDEVSVKTMSELTSKLKAKEKENLKAFNSVKVPTDYASWDKEKLVEYWGGTFFSSPGLSDQGKVAKSSVRRKISAMSVSAPAKAEEPKPAAEAAAEVPAPDAAAEAVPADMNPSAAEAQAEQADILADQKAIEADAEASQNAEQPEQSHTWVYVLVLVILIAVVIWLVVYAANLMKKQPSEERAESAGSADINELKEQAHAAITKKNEEIEDLRRRLQREEEKSASLGKELEIIKLERSRVMTQVDQLRDENLRVNNELESLRASAKAAPARPRVPREEAPARRREAAPEPAREEPQILKVIYLGRANSRGLFVRGDRRISIGNTIYRLDTNDGLVGTFHVVDEPEIVDVALSDPQEYLAGGCTGEDLDDTAGVTRIITESAGTAIFENGYWKVLRKSRIRYE